MFTRRFFGLVLVLFIALSTFIPSASMASPLASVVYVATTGSDSNNCASVSTPCRTINGAIAKVDYGGTVKIAAGTYFEVFELAKSVKLEGSGRMTTVIDGNKINRVLGLQFGHKVSLSKMTIRNGKTGNGAGIHVSDSTITLDDVLLTSNQADGDGGGIFNSGGNVTIKNSVVSSNMGGGIHNEDGTMVVDNVTIENNISGDDGGGIENTSVFVPTTITITNVTVNNNSSGGISNGGFADTRAVLNNVTIANNNGTTFGSGLSNSANMILVNVTISDHKVGIYAGGPGTMQATNTIVARSSEVNCDSPLTSKGYNIEDQNTCGFIAQGDQRNIDPKLATLQNNGGSTKTEALLAGSPAIDAGNAQSCPKQDQRNQQRPQGKACDVGAYEFQQTTEVAVLLHGWEGMPFLTTSQFTCTDKDGNPNITLYQPNNNLGTQDSDILQMAQWLYNDGKQVWLAHVDTGKEGTASLEKNAECLKEQLAVVDDYASDGQVDLVAHSMGGLVSRALIEPAKNTTRVYEGNVKNFITLGSPHQGIPDVTLSWAQNMFLLFGLNFINQQGFIDMKYGMGEFNNTHHRRNKDIAYYVVGGDLQPLNARSYALGLQRLIKGKNDGTIETASALGLPGKDIYKLTTNEAHISSFGTFSYFSPFPGLNYSDSYYSCVYPVIVRDQTYGCGNVSAAVAMQTEEPELNTYTPTMSGNLASGQTTSTTVTVQGGAGYFYVYTKGGESTFKLQRPDGQVIDSAYAAAHPNEVIYESTAISADLSLDSYYSPLATAGNWKMELSANGDTMYVMSAAVESNIILNTAAAPNWYHIDDTATITATVSGTTLSANVSAEILTPVGITNTITLVHQGGNQYEGIYLPNAGAGRYLLTTTAVASTYQRKAEASFTVVSDTVTLTNIYTDTAYRVRSSDPLYEYLNVGVGVNQVTAGTYTVIGTLRFGSREIATAATEIRSTGGQSTVLQFSGEDIHTAANNGQYVLDVKIIKDDLATILEQKGVYITKSYTANQFGLNKRNFLPLAVKQ